MTGEWEIIENEACPLPQKIATGFHDAFKDYVGASYKPVLYIATQLVNGTNHMFICEQTLITNPIHLGYAKVILHEDLKGVFTVGPIETIV
ncbi:hypothetical protein MmiAt1_05650 [Methanimicrococcus sp. At1]|uniref:Uncharacterized protein n=1 Tax=Methanimicrococcus hacksteinii TaxID=3028293 RepID=A0ABU3VNN5_9EURY|nr:hypothetical protein [Methanimicrococcus sp. At1]MDV0445013.1 hypothetical protein [Methanimicrococcus sp. At1]